MYTKGYKITNNTSKVQTSIRVTLVGYEIITAIYGIPADWVLRNVEWKNVSGVWYTVLTFGGSSISSGASVTIGWRTSDNSCRVADVRWGTGDAVVPTWLGGVPGGGSALYNFPTHRDLTIIIANDTDGPLTLADVEYSTPPKMLKLKELAHKLSKESDGTGNILVNLAPLPSDILLPGYLELDPERMQVWPTDILKPGEHTALLLHDVDPGMAFIMSGVVKGNAGTECADSAGKYLGWIEQSIAEVYTPEDI